jgi:hypothetical protein
MDRNDRIDEVMACSEDQPCAVCRHKDLNEELVTMAAIDPHAAYTSGGTMMSDFGEPWAHWKPLIEAKYGVELPDDQPCFHNLLPFLAQNRTK